MEQALELLGLHFDPINAVMLVGFAIAAWVKMRGTLRWHTTWIKEHDADCKEREKILSELRNNGTKLTVLIESNCDRIERLENQVDRLSVK